MFEQKHPKVRFAPSPTGQLHLGGARTALFNYLFTKNQRGQFYLRIEDTDKERSRQEYIDQICDSMKWLGLEWDGEPLFQSDRLNQYQSAIHKLLASGYAYRCFCSKEDLQNARVAGTYKYPGTCRNITGNDESEKLNSGFDFVVRLKVMAGKTIFNDLIYDEIKVDHNDLDDFIIARSDGNPTYNLVVVVDDHEMEITHVIRGEDHISNTPKQILIYQALGFDLPQFAHLPMILGPDKKRLSKRHSAPGIQEFRDVGYLPDALLNYLVLLGWNPATDQELYTMDEMIESFSISKVQKKGAVYDEKKLQWISGQHIMRKGSAKILEGIHAFDPEWGLGFEKQYLYAVLEQLKQRSKSLKDFITQSSYFFNDPIEYDTKSALKCWKDEVTNSMVKSFIEKLNTLTEWVAQEIETALRSMAEELEISPGKIIHPTRLALSGISNGPSLFSMMEILGKDVCIRRLNKAMELLPH